MCPLIGIDQSREMDGQGEQGDQIEKGKKNRAKAIMTCKLVLGWAQREGTAQIQMLRLPLLEQSIIIKA